MSVSSARRAIQKVYDKVGACVSLKFSDGIYSTRTRDYRLSDAHGHTFAPAVVLSFYPSLFQKSITARESTEILSIEFVDERHAEVKARDHFEYTVRSPASKIETVRMQTPLKDSWVLLPSGWHLKSSRALADATVEKVASETH